VTTEIKSGLSTLPRRDAHRKAFPDEAGEGHLDFGLVAALIRAQPSQGDESSNRLSPKLQPKAGDALRSRGPRRRN